MPECHTIYYPNDEPLASIVTAFGISSRNYRRVKFSKPIQTFPTEQVSEVRSNIFNERCS